MIEEQPMNPDSGATPEIAPTKPSAIRVRGLAKRFGTRNYVAAYATAVELAAISFIILIAMEFFRKRSLKTNT
jgi:hypothetical protein